MTMPVCVASPLEGVFVGHLPLSRLRMKSLVRYFGLGGSGLLRRHSLGGVVVGLKYHMVIARLQFLACFDLGG